MARAWEPRGRRWPVTLTEGPVTLRPLRHRDRLEWDRVRQRNRSWLRPWEATLPPGSAPGPASFPALVRTLNEQGREGRMLPWLVCYAPEPGAKPALAGQVTVSGIVGGSASWAQIGYWVDEQWAGRGLIPTGVAMAVDHCFVELGLHRIEIAIRPENEKSLRVVQKLGLRPEGLRPRYLHIDGDWRDHLVFALHSDEVTGSLVDRVRQQQK